MMIKQLLQKTLRAGLPGLLALALAGCAVFEPAPTPVPTMDPVVIADMAVRTMEAKITQAAIDNPTPTPLPTATPLPTPTAPPPATPIPAATVASGPAPTQPVQGLAAKFLYASTFPENKRNYVPNERFSVGIGFQNVGTVAWPPGYKVVMYSFTGEFTAAPEASTSNAIAPGQKVDFSLWAYGSESLGQHSWVYQLYTENGVPVPGGAAYFTYTAE